jgi:hypothetical protein
VITVCPRSVPFVRDFLFEGVLMMNSQAKFQKILEPGRIGKMELRNRIVMPPMATGYADENGFVTERLKDYYEARAKGGVGLVIVELCCVDTSVGRGFTHQMAIDDDKYIPGLRELTQVIKKHGAKASIQLQHMGLEANPNLSKYPAVGPSAVQMRKDQNPRELTIDQIGEIVQQFAKAAGRVCRFYTFETEVTLRHQNDSITTSSGRGHTMCCQNLLNVRSSNHKCPFWAPNPGDSEGKRSGGTL